ncbi:MAG: GerMN domain-containing protein [Myxococcota bacterium]
MPTASLTLFPAPAAWASRGRHAALPWSDVLARAEKPELWPGGGAIDAAEARLPAWTFAAFRDDARVVARDSATAEAQTRARVLEVNGLFLEYEDEPGADADAIARWWAGRLFLAYTTAFHDRPLGDRPEGPRWRVAVPFARGVGLAAAVEVARWARHPRRRAGTLADATEEPWRAPALPALPAGVAVRAAFFDGKGTAVVDLSGLAERLPGGSDAEVLALWSVVDALAFNFPADARRVRVLLDGREADSLGHVSLAAPLVPRRDLVIGEIPPLAIPVAAGTPAPTEEDDAPSPFDDLVPTTP